jgi:hypothetical protein
MQEQLASCGVVIDQLIDQTGQQLAGVLSDIATATRTLHNAC